MIKFDTKSWIEGVDGVRKNIVVTSKLPCKMSSLVLGVGLIVGGAVCLMISSFKTGALAYDSAEFDTLNSLGLIHSDDYVDDLKRGGE